MAQICIFSRIVQHHHLETWLLLTQWTAWEGSGTRWERAFVIWGSKMANFDRICRSWVMGHR